MLNNYRALVKYTEYTEDGILQIDNHILERQIRSIALGGAKLSTCLLVLIVAVNWQLLSTVLFLLVNFKNSILPYG